MVRAAMGIVQTGDAIRFDTGAPMFLDEGWQSLKIVVFCTLAAMVYGILHDQVTAHLCVEYFTIAHPPVFPTRSPFLLALGWGVLATWAVGLSLGGGLALAARLGSRPRLALGDLRTSVAKVTVATAVAALLAGCLGAWLVASGKTPVPEGWAILIPRGKQVAFSADFWAHITSYGFGSAAGVLLIVHTLWRRVRLSTPRH